ncbi:DUF3349 domain-containing protein [uncultured Friedmanniella sp.]|uniref:DUF3349 domain-containing protein n=1 Tax=uncultured Friedmanniella sp. TaxID=335381 RepID=UPI0035CC764A
MSMPAFLSSVVGWLRAGYPEGIPENDYIPLVAVLARRLSQEEVQEVAAALAQSGDMPIGNIDIGTLITKVTNELPREEDVTRVRSKLALGGWPLADPRPAL